MLKTFKSKIVLKDVFDSILPFHYLINFIGIGYYNISRLENGRRFYKVTPLLIFRYICLSIVFIASYLYFNIQANISTSGPNLAYWVFYFANIVLKILAGTNLFLGLTHYRQIGTILNGIDEIDSTLEKIGVKVNHWYVNWP